jgi:uncharacterized protein (TIGR00369 family)
VSDPNSPLDALFAQSSYSKMMAFRLIQAGDGRARIECVVSPVHTNTSGVCHGGVISGLVDATAGVAAKTRFAEPEQVVATVSLTVNYLRPALVGRTLVAEARVSGGRRILSCEIAVRDDEGEAIASGLATIHARAKHP